MKKCLIAVLCILFITILNGCGSCSGNSASEDSYTYNTWTTSLGNNWNPHTWETSSDDVILSYITTPFVSMSIKDSSNGEYQWVYEMATSIEDVTKENQKDLIKFKSTLPEGVNNVSEVEKGYVFDITLNENAKWENGEAITADDYVYSMQKLLDSKMRNYRSNLYVFGESAIAGALAYYNSEAPIYDSVVPSYNEGLTPDYSFDTSKNDVYINLDSSEMTIYSYSFKEMQNYIADEFINKYNEIYEDLNNEANAYGYILVTDANKDKIIELMDYYLKVLGYSIYNNEENKDVNSKLFKEFLFYVREVGDKVSYDSVGLYKVDDYKIRYVLQTYQDYNYFLTSLTSNWLVHKKTYEDGFNTSGLLVTTNYGTSKETSISYGPYKIDSIQKDKQIVLVQNENWFGFTKNSDGTLYSETNFEVDGEKIQQYQTTKIVIDVLTEESAKQRFFVGELTEWAPSASELSSYTLSDKLYQVDETYTMSLFFNTNIESLKTLDRVKGNKNCVVISNDKFRKAFSLAINRGEWVTVTAGYKPAYALLNNLYYYDIYNNPQSMYRATDEAMNAICNLYNIKYGENEVYKTLKEAYESVKGYNLTEAKSLMKDACDELIENNLYVKGDPIKIKIAWSKGALTSDDNAQVALLQKYLKEAAMDSGFGEITIEAIGNITDRYGDVPKGEYAIGYGAWGGAAFYPFRNFQLYMDPSKNKVNELGCWDPVTEKLTISIKGRHVTKTYQQWSNSMTGVGEFADSDFETKLLILSSLEEAFLKFYYRIPLASSAQCFLLSYQVDYYTNNYNIMYGFGGLRLMKYYYNDKQWQDYLSNKGGNLTYN